MDSQQPTTPCVSVIMPAHNAEATIQASIRSVLAQTLPDWELIIINDASTDKTAELAKAFTDKDNRIHLLTNENNKGVAVSRNIGIEQSKGNDIAFLDSDDLWREDKLSKQIEFMQATGADISYTATAYMYEETQSGYVLRAKRELTYKELLKRNLMSCSSVMVKREVIAQTPFVQGEYHEDYAAWMKILRKVKCAYGLDEPLLTYRSSRKSKSGRLLNSGVMTYLAYRHVGYITIVALFLTLRYALHSISKRVLVRSVRQN